MESKDLTKALTNSEQDSENNADKTWTEKIFTKGYDKLSAAEKFYHIKSVIGNYIEDIPRQVIESFRPPQERRSQLEFKIEESLTRDKQNQDFKNWLDEKIKVLNLEFHKIYKEVRKYSKSIAEEVLTYWAFLNFNIVKTVINDKYSERLLNFRSLSRQDFVSIALQSLKKSLSVWDPSKSESSEEGSVYGFVKNLMLQMISNFYLDNNNPVRIAREFQRETIAKKFKAMQNPELGGNGYDEHPLLLTKPVYVQPFQDLIEDDKALESIAFHEALTYDPREKIYKQLEFEELKTVIRRVAKELFPKQSRFRNKSRSRRSNDSNNKKHKNRKNHRTYEKIVNLFLQGFRDSEIARRVGVSREWVRQVRNRLIQRVRAELGVSNHDS
ncbi:helix-turn-helix domain-containing protein [Candidatus Woesearchaeota archaeon]|nr:helix-turn-helix domain-containing protein [Candidatus Woesearchaeota archaeon]